MQLSLSGFSEIRKTVVSWLHTLDKLLQSHPEASQPIKRGIWGRVIILGGGIENILSSGGSVRNKFFGVVSLCTLTTKTRCHAGEKLSEAQTCTTLLESQQVLHEFPSTDSPNLGSFSWRPNPVAYWELEKWALECRWRNVNQGLGKWSLSVLPEASRLLLAITHTGFSYSHLKGEHIEGHTGSEYVCRAAVDSPTAS